MKALVMGGTGFIGRRLVENLLKDDWDVTIATSGRTANPFGDEVDSVTFDRFDIASLEDKLTSPPYFDVLFDQLAFGPNDARAICEVFKGRIGHYVFTSSGAVYSGESDSRKETSFEPGKHGLIEGSVGELGYAEGKRQVEAYMFQKAPFPVAAARFPIVIGHDDSSERFQKHVNSVYEGKNVTIPEGCKMRNYVWVEDAGRFLFWLGKSRKTGSYNGCTPYGLTAEEMVKRIGAIVGKEAKISKSGGEISSYYIDHDAILDASKAQSEGFNFTPLDDWLSREALKVISRGGKSPNSGMYFSDLFKKQ